MGNSKSVSKNHDDKKIDEMFSELENRRNRHMNNSFLEKESQIILSGMDLLFLQRIRPNDREISIYMSFDESGILSGIFPGFRRIS